MPHPRPAIRLGIIGLGAMGAEMLAVAAKHPDFTVRRACDIDRSTLDRLAASHPAVSFSPRTKDITGAADLDAVYVATPPALHASLAIAAMDSGKAVFCEKPLAVSLADGRWMRAVAETSELAAVVNFALSDRHAVLHLERGLRSGEAGTPLGVDVRLQFPRWPRDFQSTATWLAGREQGGFVREVFSHFAYLTDRLLGPLQPVEVSVDYPAGRPAASEIAAHGLLRAGAVPVHVSAIAGMAGPERYDWILWGTKRSYRLRDWGELHVCDGAGWTPVPLDDDDRGSEATRLSLFAAAIRGQRQANLADFSVAFRVQQVVEAFHQVRDQSCE